MSAQGGTLAGPRTLHIPIWPLAALIVVSALTLVGLQLLREGRPAAPAARTERFDWSSTVGHPALRRGTVPAVDAAVIEGSAAAIREFGAGGPYHASGRAHEVIPAAQVAGVTSVTGLENPGAWFTETREGSADYRKCSHCHQRI